MNRNEGPADEASIGRMESKDTAMGEPGSRRRFLKGGLAAAAGVAASSMWDTTAALAQENVSAAPGPPSMIDDEAYWEKVRAQFHLNPDTIYLNNGTLGLCPKPVTQAVYDGYVYLAEAGSEGRSQLWDEVEASRKTAARFLGAGENEMVLTRNATQGLSVIANGIRMEPGDEVLMTSDEHIAGIQPWTRRARRFGIQVNQVQIPSPPKSKQEVVDLFEQALTPRTKVIFFCHVTRGPGLLYPVRELCDMAREKGIVSAVDGAQTPGMTPVNLHEMGCDLFATSLHKWALTPSGTGCLYVREGFQETFWPTSDGNGPWDDREQQLWRIGPHGTYERPIRAAIKPALDFLNSIGMDAIYARDRMLSDYLKERLMEMPGISLGTSTEHALSSPGITSFGVEGWDTSLLRGILRGKAGIVVSRDQRRSHDMIRVSTHFYNTPAEVDRLLEVMKEIL
ncbi:MAG: aminotransferase class V-fold PLP-dependent enzyme [Gemmatimonadetes bacterium]|nr:aminotransferase class V-fold PLP-dependent enzyme [Gemmatimonadota bacterium]MYG16556.1 aminotransferase class V-fold PLP-dependent enzyme [Gemmatimonadota bacterium]